MNVREWALPVYTILIQLAVGSLFILWLVRTWAESKLTSNEVDHVIINPLLVIVFTIMVAMIGAHFHLSKPFHSFYAALNFKSSWLSREIVFTILFFSTASSLLYLTYTHSLRRRLITILGWLASLWGALLIYCMTSIYLIPTQVAWNSKTVYLSFFNTALILGSMTIITLMVLDIKFAEIKKSDDVELRAQVIQGSFSGLATLTILLAVSSIAILLAQIFMLAGGDLTARTSLSLLLDLYLPLFVLRLAFLILACFLLGITAYRLHSKRITHQSLMTPVYLSCLFILIGEILGRFLFYATHIRVGI